MNKHIVRTSIEDLGVIPSVRTPSPADARFAAETVSAAGVPIIEISMSVPGAEAVIAELARSMPDLIVGAGTILDLTTAHHAVHAGARFLTSPGLDLQVVAFALKEGVLVMPGAMTPTEVTTAWQAGADLVRVFPCAPQGGPSYIHALKAPFPQVPLVAAGGVNQQTAGEFIAAGAAAIAVGRELIPRKALQHRDRDWIAELARRFLKSVQEARDQTVLLDDASIDHADADRGRDDP